MEPQLGLRFLKLFMDRVERVAALRMQVTVGRLSVDVYPGGSGAWTVFLDGKPMGCYGMRTMLFLVTPFLGELEDEARKAAFAINDQLRAAIRVLEPEKDPATHPALPREHLMPNGDLFVVRECTGDEEGCVVLEKWPARPAPTGIDRAVDDYARAATGQAAAHPEGEVDQEPGDEFHIPREALDARLPSPSTDPEEKP